MIAAIILNRVHLLFILLFGFSIAIQAQNKNEKLNYVPYYAEIYKADSLFILKNYSETFKILDNVLQKYKRVDGWFVDVSTTYLLSKNKVSKIEYRDIENYLREKAYDTDAILKNKEVAEILAKFNVKKENIEKIVRENVSKINLPLRLELGQISLDDQKVRTIIKNNDSIKKVDGKHSERLKEIIKTYGFPNKNIVGAYLVEGKHSNIALDLLFNHMSYNGDYEYFKKVLPEFIKNGTCSPFIYAMMEDRRNEISNQYPQYYIIAQVPHNADKKKINAIRKSIGMPSLEYQKFKLETVNN